MKSAPCLRNISKIQVTIRRKDFQSESQEIEIGNPKMQLMNPGITLPQDLRRNAVGPSNTNKVAYPESWFHHGTGCRELNGSPRGPRWPIKDSVSQLSTPSSVCFGREFTYRVVTRMWSGLSGVRGDSPLTKRSEGLSPMFWCCCRTGPWPPAPWSGDIASVKDPSAGKLTPLEFKAPSRWSACYWAGRSKLGTFP